MLRPFPCGNWTGVRSVFRHFPEGLGRQSNPKTNITVAVVRVVVVAVGRAQVRRVVVPTAAPIDPVRATHITEPLFHVAKRAAKFIKKRLLSAIRTNE